MLPESLLETIEHEVIRDMELKVNGINGSRTYASKLVSVTVRIGGDYRTLEFVTMREINISLNLPGLSKIVMHFDERGYKFADKNIFNCKNKLDDIRMILGVESAHCFRDESVHFGKSSVYIKTQLGTMLLGNLGQLKEDLPQLPICPDILNDVTSMACNIVQRPYNESGSRQRLTGESEESLEYQGLDKQCSSVLQKETEIFNDDSVNLNDELFQYLLDNTQRAENGRLIMPLLWNGKVKHHLARNFELAKNILFSNQRKYAKEPLRYGMIDENFRELEELGVIERIPNLDQFLNEAPSASFLAHQPIFRLSKETTKCRTVFMSNLCEKGRGVQPMISHNMAMHPGYCMNNKLTTSLTMLRFDKKVLVWDLKKAFCQIALPPSDQNKLCFLWYKNWKNGDLTLQAFKNLRLSFGLVCSPTILMTALYIILMRDIERDPPDLVDLKANIYNLTYMDNCGLTKDSTESLVEAYENLEGIFAPYGFELQQFATNDSFLRNKLEPNDSTVGLFGILWNTLDDTYLINKIDLDPTANTKRLTLKTFQSIFDPQNFTLPMQNRAKLFIHKLQNRTDLNWDTQISLEDAREWACIARQWNKAPPISVERFIGNRGDAYRLIAFSDSSKYIYGTVLYLQNLVDMKVSFLGAKNRLVNKQLESKTIPSLEFNGIVLGAETLIEMKNELAGPNVVQPINIVDMHLYSDSLVALQWLSSYAKLEKMNKKTVFVRNRLQKLDDMCENNPITFSFVDGIVNPSDLVTRPVSYDVLMGSNYFTGPGFLQDPQERVSRENLLTITMPSRLQSTGESYCHLSTIKDSTNDPVIDCNRFSAFSRLVGAMKAVLHYCNLVKERVKSQFPAMFQNWNVDEGNATAYLIRQEQQRSYPEVFNYFDSGSRKHKDLPNLVRQLRLFVDKVGLIRVGSKLKSKNKSGSYCPILLPKANYLTELIIASAHKKLRHGGGVYAVITELRKKFWIPSHFSTVKKVVEKCLDCRRRNNRVLKLSTNDYRDFRLNPSKTVFATVFLDNFGPFYVTISGKRQKVWVLIITCLFSRAINLKLVMDCTTEEFLRALELHSFEFGLPAQVHSDLGSNLVSGADVIQDFLKDPQTLAYFKENGVQITGFEHCYKGCSKLASLVESMVNVSKRLLAGSVGKNVLTFRDFEFFLMEARHLANRRPVAFKGSLRSENVDEPPKAITPEMLIHGRELISANIIPGLQPVPLIDPDWELDPCDRARDMYSKLRDVRAKLIEIYSREFIYHLIDQATNVKDRYSKVTHKGIDPGDIVLIKDPFIKPHNYPLARVISVQKNSIGEVVGAELKKGSTNEIVKRHSSCIVPLLRMCEAEKPIDTEEAVEQMTCSRRPSPPKRKRRAAAVLSERRTRDMM